MCTHKTSSCCGPLLVLWRLLRSARGTPQSGLPGLRVVLGQHLESMPHSQVLGGFPSTFFPFTRALLPLPPSSWLCLVASPCVLGSFVLHMALGFHLGLCPSCPEPLGPSVDPELSYPGSGANSPDSLKRPGSVHGGWRGPTTWPARSGGGMCSSQAPSCW